MFPYETPRRERAPHASALASRRRDGSLGGAQGIRQAHARRREGRHEGPGVRSGDGARDRRLNDFAI